EYALGVDLGLDWLFFPRAIAITGVPFGEQLAPTAAWVFLAFGIALPLLLTGRARAAVAAQCLALGAGLVAVLALVGYAYGAEGLYFLGSAARVARSTAVGILATAAGLFLCRPRHGPASVVTAPD